jgi:teichuronic acid biosynthesis glycosyltransferase TuaG
LNLTKLDVDGVPFVSVIMPAYNAGNYIAESIQTVKDQTFSNWELIIVDDGSTDSTSHIVKCLQATDTRIKYYFQKNQKQAAARNAGIHRAIGQWIAFLDADDFWMPDKLFKQVSIAERKQYDIIFTNGYCLFEETKGVGPYDSLTGSFSGAELYKLLFQHNHIPVLSVMVSKALVNKIGLQDEALLAHGCEDWDYWLRCSRSGASFLGLDDRLFKYRVHSQGTSSNKSFMHLASCYVLLKNYDSSLLSNSEQTIAKKRIISELKVILNNMDNIGMQKELFYLLKLLGNLPGDRLRYKVVYWFAIIFKTKSWRVVRYLL